MKLATAKDALAVDPRAQSGKQPLDTQNKDGSAAAFEGLLAEIGTDAKAPGASDASAPTATTGGPLTLVRSSTALTAGAATTDANTQSAGTSNETLVNALMDILGQAAGPKTKAAAGPEADAKAATPQPDSETSDAFGSVLKKLSSKDETTDDATAPAATTTTGPADLMSMLALGAALPAQSAPQTAAPPTSTPQRAPLALVGATTPGDAVPTEAQEVLVSEVATATHLAPVNPAQGQSATTSTATSKTGAAKSTDTLASNALPSDAPLAAEPPPAVSETPKDTARPSTSGSNPKTATATDDVTSSARADAEPTAAAPPPGVAFGPTRAIATAIATVATQVATRAAATAEPDSPKAPLAVARTLTLQMSPAQLGTVDIRLHMTGQALDVQLTVSSQETLGIVSRERDTLAGALHDQNYQLNSLVIQDGGAAASSGGNNATQGNGFSSAGSDRQAGSGSDSQSGSRQGQSRQQPWDDTPRGSPPSRAPDTGSRALFV